ncbi:hypothetical protein [Streptomyces olivoreticuli]|uniref:hypothetical protein n=1 Tax=Streptomyces olivoreticuli TaxID=68246 RepID=UPI000E23D428|nr:hypothetical protein [Streptomyces olivoreticuli]
MTIKHPTPRLHEIIRPRTGTFLLSRWGTGTPDRTRAAAEAIAEEWTTGAKPEGHLAQHMYLDVDGTGILHYAQWRSDEEHLEFARALRPAVISRVDRLVPGIERPGLRRTRLHRSVVTDATSAAGILAVTTLATPDPEPRPGALAAHVHAGTDGGPAVELAEWADLAAYEAAAGERPGADVRLYTYYRAV